MEQNSSLLIRDFPIQPLWLTIGCQLGREAKLRAEVRRHAKFIGMGAVLWEPGFLKR